MYHGREAELQSRVNQARVRVEYVNSGDRARAIELVRAFARDVVALDRPAVDDGLDEDIECAAAGVEVRRS
jgi:hypothetical protein